MIEALQNKKNSIALVGASNNPKKYGNKILLDLLEKGHIVYPINKNESQIEGLKSYKKVSDLPSLPSIINFVVPPNEGIEVTTLSEVTLWLGSRMLEGELVDASAAASP